MRQALFRSYNLSKHWMFAMKPANARSFHCQRQTSAAAGPTRFRQRACAPQAGGGGGGHGRGGDLERRQRKLASLMPFRSPLEHLMNFDLVDPVFDWPARSAHYHENIHVDVIENDDDYEIKADVPGVNKESLKVDVSGDTLTLSIAEQEEHTRSDGEGNRRILVQERASRYVSRSLQLPEGADTESIAAQYADGVLTLRVPKQAHVTAKRRQISIE